MRIIGNTVGTNIPKPNLKQGNPKKGDYVKGKEVIPTKISQLENNAGYVNQVQIENGINLVDIDTGVKYKLYMANGKLKAAQTITVNVNASSGDVAFTSNGLTHNSIGEFDAASGERIEITLAPAGFATGIEYANVEMGGSDITYDVYTKTETGGKIVIPAVTDHVFISAQGEYERRRIVYDLENCGGHYTETVTNGESLYFTIEPEDGLVVDVVRITMGNKDITATAYLGDGTVYIEAITDDVSISAYAH